MNIEGMTRKYASCVEGLDAGMTCGTCKHMDINEDVEPCNNCFNEMIGLPINPTNWETK